MSTARRPVAIAMIAALLLTMITLLASPQPAAAQDDCVAADTIAGVASASDDFNILVAALSAADLVGAVADTEAELTVFAPTDAAFTATATALGYDGDTSDEGAIATWLVETLGAQLTPVLTYHVAAGTLLATDVAAAPVTTLEGTTVSVDDLDIATADVTTCNGVIHTINNVLIPAQTAAALAPEPTPVPTLAPVVISPAPAPLAPVLIGPVLPAPVAVSPIITTPVVVARVVIAPTPTVEKKTEVTHAAADDKKTEVAHAAADDKKAEEAKPTPTVDKKAGTADTADDKKTEAAGAAALAHTGSTTSPLLLISSVLLIVGGILTLATRRPRSQA